MRSRWQNGHDLGQAREKTRPPNWVKLARKGASSSWELTIAGLLEQFGAGLDGYPNVDAITGVGAWGGLGLLRLDGAFAGASNLTRVPDTLPETVTSLFSIFWGASSFNHPIGNWDTSNVQTMQNMLSDATSFDQPIGDWDTTNVTNMLGMFADASCVQPTHRQLGHQQRHKHEQPCSKTRSAFNQDHRQLGHEPTSYDMANMFIGNASAFNQPIGSWNTSNVTHMGGMFRGRHGRSTNPSATGTPATSPTCSFMFHDAVVVQPAHRQLEHQQRHRHGQHVRGVVVQPGPVRLVCPADPQPSRWVR
jgi:surface protein